MQINDRGHGMKTRHAACVIVLASAATAMLLTCASADKPATLPARIALPAPRQEGPLTVERAIAQRRSVRRFADRAVSIKQLSQILWSAQGVTDHQQGLRAAPSAGALYPIEMYVVAGNVADLAAGVYRYLPREHRLMRVASGDRRKALVDAALGQGSVRNAPAILVVSGVYSRTAAKYGERAARYVHMEAGAAAQNVYLQAEALDLATVLVGAFGDRQVQEALELPKDHEPLVLLPVGWEE